jgi:predicted RNA-binding Zn-ribbon protein involved in translation (DUF1610 family)
MMKTETTCPNCHDQIMITPWVDDKCPTCGTVGHWETMECEEGVDDHWDIFVWGNTHTSNPLLRGIQALEFMR